MDNKSLFKKPVPLEYPQYFRPGMGTENVAPFLRSLVQLVRPQHILEIGAGYTSPFLLEGLVNNERVLDDGNLDKNILRTKKYDPKLVIIDDVPLAKLLKKTGMEQIINSKYTEFIEGIFQGKAKKLKERYSF